jgi:hypothetical protein
MNGVERFKDIHQQVLMMSVLVIEYNVLTLRNISISVSGTTDISTQIKLHLKRTSLVEIK